MMNKEFTAIIPTWRPGNEFGELIRRLQKQKLPPKRILIINTDERYFKEDLIGDWTDVSVLHIEKKDFDHALTRNLGVSLSDTPFLLFMTMDAIPADRNLTKILLDAFDDPLVAVSFARQMPVKECGRLERKIREFNYPEQSRVKSWADTKEMGVKAFFCSNVCAMYRRDVYTELGGFEGPAIFNEDMVYAGRALKAGKYIAYCADAKVWHSHNYSALDQFHRNFDLGVSQSLYPELFDEVPSEKTGLAMIRTVSASLLKEGAPFSVIRLFWQSGWKYAGYRLGKSWQKLPLFVRKRFSMNPGYWEMEV